MDTHMFGISSSNHDGISSVQTRGQMRILASELGEAQSLEGAASVRPGEGESVEIRP